MKAIATKLEMCIPRALRAPGGIIQEGTIKYKGKTLLIDYRPVPPHALTGKEDLVVKVEKERSATILEVAVAWDPLVKRAHCT